MDKIAHIGFPKTGTTYLQYDVFPNLSGVNYISFETCMSLFAEMIYLDDLDFNQVKINKNVNKEIKKNAINLFSFESLVGNPFVFKGVNRSRVSYRLKETGINKIIITIRKQEEIIDSIYRQYVYQGGVTSFKEFIYGIKSYKLAAQPFNMDFLNFQNLIEHYQMLFGKENVLVLPYEMLRQDRKALNDKIIQFCGAESLNEGKKVNQRNVSLSNFSTGLIRALNPYLSNSMSPRHLISHKISSKNLKKLFQVIIEPYFLRYIAKKKNYASKKDLEFIRNYYRESNKNLDLNLEELGYSI